MHQKEQSKKRILKTSAIVGLASALTIGSCVPAFAAETNSLSDLLNSLYQLSQDSHDVNLDGINLNDINLDDISLDDINLDDINISSKPEYSDTLEDVYRDNQKAFQMIEELVNTMLEGSDMTISFDVQDNEFNATYIVNEVFSKKDIEYYNMLMENDEESKQDLFDGVQQTLDGLLEMAEGYDIDQDAIVISFKLEDKKGNLIYEARQMNGEINPDIEQMIDESIYDMDWFDSCFLLDDAWISLPDTYATFEDNGWELDDDSYLFETLDYDECYELLDISNPDYDGIYAAISFYNDSEETQDLIDCPVYGFGCMLSDEDGDIPDMMLPGGIQFGDSTEEIEAQYGPADDIDEDGSSSYLTYEDEDGYSLALYMEDDELVGFFVSNVSDYIQ